MSDPSRVPLAVKELVVRRGGRTILAGVSLSVARGEVVAVVGANGTGKSTLLACVAGVLPPRAGRVEIAGHAVWGADGALARRALGYAPEGSDPPGYLTGAELWALVAATRGTPPPDATVAAAFGLDAVARVRIDRMSLGMRRRACLGAAWLGPPALLVLDEPDNGLDAARLDALVEQVGILARAGGAVLVATHDPAVIDRMDARRFTLG
jgi:ABC-2 type transport system ATP-binding protein